jgi:aminopeptidase N
MKKSYYLFLMCLLANTAHSQTTNATEDDSWKNVYRASYSKVNDLVHTKLEVKFDFAKAYLYGKAWITLTPHFYATDSLLLDAKSMTINNVGVIKGNTTQPLKYTYDDLQLNIKLDKAYSNTEKYTIYIDYVSKPNEAKVQGSAVITDAKGLYFINPTGADKDKSTQIWTQGETEASSVWFPTIDKSNQKSTEEIYMTVPDKFVTLSNGILVNKKKNADGTRTDYWKMDLPHAPYLFFMGVGDFAIITDRYKGKEVSYYVEKEQAPFARKIFGNTPEMMKFFSDKLGVEYPWAKYSQIVGRDFVSGAMENTTATLHQESAYQNARELTDGNGWESTVAHELFHHWFGDLVTAESWSNLTVNESFANYSETLWNEYKYGNDDGDAQNYSDMQAYLDAPVNATKDLVRFNYADKEDMFDAVSYNKGGRILHMLRNYVGDDAFFKSLNNYLTTNKFKAAEASQLRLAFEETTGKDLNWFWNQWYYGNGHPALNINYKYNDAAGKATVIIEQTQKTNKIFKLPIAIDIYNGAAKKRYKVLLQNKIDSFVFNYTTKPDLINVDGDKILLTIKMDDKTVENYLHQFKYAPLYLDRKEALDYFAANNNPAIAMGLKDKYAPLRRSTINVIGTLSLADDKEVVKEIEAIANTEVDKKTKGAALQFLAAKKDKKYLTLFEKNVNDSSYTVAGAALDGLAALQPEKAYQLAKKYSADAKGGLGEVVNAILITQGTEADADFITKRYDNMPLGQSKIDATVAFASYLQSIKNMDDVKKGIKAILKLKESVPAQYKQYTDPPINQSLNKLGAAKGKEIIDFIKQSSSK